MTKEQIAHYLIDNCTVNAPDGAVVGTGLKELWMKIFNNGKTSNIQKSDVAITLAEW